MQNLIAQSKSPPFYYQRNTTMNELILTPAITIVVVAAILCVSSIYKAKLSAQKAVSNDLEQTLKQLALDVSELKDKAGIKQLQSYVRR